MQVLLICDDFYHPGEILEPIEAFLAGEGITTDIRRDAENIDFGNELARYGAVILSKSGQERDSGPWQTVRAVRAFIDYAEGGGGLIFAHSGIVSDNIDMQKLIGCKFLSHPEEHCPVTFTKTADHPVMAGIKPFTVTDEHYYIEIIDSSAEITALYETAEASMPGCLVRTQGAGRICCITPGHNAPIWREAGFQRLVLNVVRWCGTTAVYRRTGGNT